MRAHPQRIKGPSADLIGTTKTTTWRSGSHSIPTFPVYCRLVSPLRHGLFFSAQKVTMKMMRWLPVQLVCSPVSVVAAPSWRSWGVPNGFAGLIGGMGVFVSNRGRHTIVDTQQHYTNHDSLPSVRWSVNMKSSLVLRQATNHRLIGWPAWDWELSKLSRRRFWRSWHSVNSKKNQLQEGRPRAQCTYGPVLATRQMSTHIFRAYTLCMLHVSPVFLFVIPMKNHRIYW